MNKLYFFTFWSLCFACFDCTAMFQHPALRHRPATTLCISNKIPAHKDASPEQGLACSLYRTNKLPKLPTTRIEFNDHDFADDTAFKQVIATVFVVSTSLSTCLACAGIAVLAIKSQNN